MMATERTQDKVFKVPISETESISVEMNIPALNAENLPLIPWASTYVLASVLSKLDVVAQKQTSHIPIIELGAGIGLPGLIAAVLWHTHVVLTDLAPIVPGMAAIIDQNSALLKEHQATAGAAELDWSKPRDMILRDGTHLDGEREKAGIIITTDTIYDEDHAPMLAQTILQWLAPGPDSRVILTFPLRIAYLDYYRELWELLEKGGLIAFQEGKEEATDVGGDSWDDEKLCEWSVWKWKDVQ